MSSVGKAVSPPPSGFSDEVEGRTTQGEEVVKRTSEEAPEEHERKDDTQSAADNTNSVGKK